MKKIFALLALLILSDVLAIASCRRPQAAVRPIPEFAPVHGVFVSDILFADNLPGKALAQAVAASGTKLIVAATQPETETERLSWMKHNGLDNLGTDRLSVVPMDHDSHWVRDYGPIFVTLRDATQPDRLGLVDLEYKRDSQLDDSIPYQLGLYLGGDVRRVPLKFDGGNFLTDGRRCFVTTAIFAFNPQLPQDDKRARAEVDRLFRERIGCEETVFFADSPHEHIDMWAKIVNEKTVLVNQITPETIAKMGGIEDYQWRSDMFALRDKLDRMAEQFAKHLEVIRLPMPVPYRGVFRTYANALLVNGTVIMPHFERAAWPAGEDYPDHTFVAALENEARATYGRLGFKVTTIPSDQLMSSGGALHCVATQVPWLGRL